MTIGEAIDHALKIRDEIKMATGKDLELSVNTYSCGLFCDAIGIRIYYKPEGEEKWWVMERAFDRHILEVDGKGLIDHFHRTQATNELHGQASASTERRQPMNGTRIFCIELDRQEMPPEIIHGKAKSILKLLTEEEAIWLDRHTYGCAVFMVDGHGNTRHIPFETLSEEDRLRIQTNT